MVGVTEGNRKLPCMYSTNTKTGNKSIGPILDRDAVSYQVSAEKAEVLHRYSALCLGKSQVHSIR